MRTVTRKIYYCDFCGKHRHIRSSMEKHESHCTMNPSRTCRWGELHYVVLRPLIVQIQEMEPLDTQSVEWLREEVRGCPPCMLAVLRQSGLEYHYSASGWGRLWDYEEEVKRSRVAEREMADWQEMQEIQSTWL